MSEQTDKIVARPAVHHVANRVLPVARIAVLLVSIAAAIPTARNLYFSWLHGIPFSEVPHRLTQYDLWIKNLECKIEYRALLTASGNRLDAGACPKTGDIAIKITSDKGAVAYEWIAFDKLQKPSDNKAGLLSVLVTQAQAFGLAEPGTKARPPLLHFAQAGMEVLCRAKEGRKLVQVVKEGDKCFREIVLPLKGTIEKRQQVSCSTRC